MGAIEFIKAEGKLLVAHWGEFLTAAGIAFGIGFGIAEYHYAGRVETAEQQREFYKDCRENGRTEAPCPVIRDGKPVIKFVPKKEPVSDPAQARQIADLDKEVADLKAHPKTVIVRENGTKAHPFSDRSLCTPGSIVFEDSEVGNGKNTNIEDLHGGMCFVRSPIHGENVTVFKEN
jgi:hypothetical protein